MNHSIKIEPLKEKSISSFLMALEIYNKPTIDYRLEGCVFYLCNAWELLLKAKILNDGNKITYKDKENRTLSLSDCVSKVMTNEKDPVRLNLSIIIILRNTATHYIIPEFENTYLHFLTACVKNYVDKAYDYFNINITDYLKTDFLSMFVGTNYNNPINVLDKYGSDIEKKLADIKSNLDTFISDEGNEKIAISVSFSYYRTNNKDKKDLSYYLSKDEKADNQPVRYINQNLDPNKTHKYSRNEIVTEIKKILSKNNIDITGLSENSKKGFTTFSFDLYSKHFNIKEQTEYAFGFKMPNHTVYKYSDILITKIITELTENPNLIFEINSKRKKDKLNSKRKKVNPRGKGISST